MKIEAASISGVFTASPDVLQDERGSFFEAFRQDGLRSQTGVDFQTAQLNCSISRKGVLRGIHFKSDPPGQAKFVFVTQGAILDLVVDLRKSSETFGKFEAFESSSENHLALIVGRGIGHAFLALEENTRVNYLCDTVFQPELEFAINPFSIGFDWDQEARIRGVRELILSRKDSTAPRFSESEKLWFE